MGDGDNADALHFDAVDRGALFAATTVGRGNGGDLLKDVVAGDQLAERGVLFVEEAGVAVADEKLATGRIRAGGTGHRDDAAHVGFGVELGLHLVAGVAGAGHSTCALFGVGAAALDHKTLDDAVKRGAIVEFLVGEFLEVFDRLWRDVGPEGEGHFAEGGLDDSLFSGGAHGKRVSKPAGLT